jgi:predicted nucleotidyltransferase
MRRADVLLPARHSSDLRSRFGVDSLYLFGSTARDEASVDSDVDILVSYNLDVCVGLFGLHNLQVYLEDILGHKVDLLTLESLAQWMHDDVLKNAICVA